MEPLLPKSYKNRFPFRLATTSFIYPAGWADNVKYLAPYLDEIELVFFESDPGSLPDTEEIQRLRTLAERYDITYNVHLPIDLDLGSTDDARCRSAVHSVCRLTSLTEPLEPSTYTIHLDFEGDAAETDRVVAWQERTSASMREIIAAGPPPQMFSVENLAYPFEIAEPIVRNLGLGICFDVGHMHLSGGDVIAAWERYRDATTIVHLYGIGDKGEHLALDALPRRLAAQVIRELDRFGSVVSLEVFSHENLIGSLNQLEKLWQRWTQAP